MEFLEVMLNTYIWRHKKMSMTLLRRKEEYNAANKEHATSVKLNKGKCLAKPYPNSVSVYFWIMRFQVIFIIFFVLFWLFSISQ